MAISLRLVSRLSISYYFLEKRGAFWRGVCLEIVLRPRERVLQPLRGGICQSSIFKSVFPVSLFFPPPP
jgi:hypothetical protein